MLSKAKRTRRSKQERAAQMLATGVMTNTQIAADLGVSRMTLYRWRQNPTFEERISAICEESRREIHVEREAEWERFFNKERESSPFKSKR
jgi:DNA invertase Pin-like site-specific DNA recombinase